MPPVAVRAHLARAREHVALTRLGVDAEHLVEKPVGHVDPALGVDGEVVRKLEHRLGGLDRSGGLAGGVFAVTAAADGNEQQCEDGKPAHRP